MAIWCSGDWGWPSLIPSSFATGYDQCEEAKAAAISIDYTVGTQPVNVFIGPPCTISEWGACEFHWGTGMLTK